MAGVMGVNFMVNALLLAGTGRLSERRRNVEVLIASLLGAAYAGGCMLPRFHFLQGLHWRAVSLVLMPMLAFGIDHALWKQAGIFALLTMALEGMSMAIGRGETWALLASALGIWLLSRYAFQKGQQLEIVEIMEKGQSFQFRALKDTGNELRDPLTGESVLVLGGEMACRVSGLSKGQLQNPLTVVAECPGFRLIPYHTVAAANGLLLAKRFSKVTIHGITRSTIIAFAPNDLGGERYQALTGGIVS